MHLEVIYRHIKEKESQNAALGAATSNGPLTRPSGPYFAAATVANAEAAEAGGPAGILAAAAAAVREMCAWDW